MPTKGRGRPKKVKAELRDNTLRIRLTHEERAILDAAAGAKSLDVSAWGRMVMIEAARTAAKPSGRG